jgi:hypothetical protein
MAVLYYSVQRQNGETKERDKLVEAYDIYRDWCKKFPNEEITLVVIKGKTIYKRKGS